jgi:nitrite reductase/ring-hydroxylating ferredoxin subunit
MDQEFVAVGKLSGFRGGRARKVVVGDAEIALWRVGDSVYAVGNVCAHQHVSRIHEGILEGLTVHCPMHGWQYSLETGSVVEGSGRIPVYDVKIEGDDVFVARNPRA